MPVGVGDTPASGKLLAATLQALDGGDYRSHVDAVVSSARHAVIAQLLKAAASR
jgi:hypothetical protein